jgi:hypothetical protein
MNREGSNAANAFHPDGPPRKGAMPSSFQQQSLQRKFIYFGIIVVLITATLIFRKPGLLGHYSLEAQADKLSMREQNLGEVDLTGSAVRLMLTGSRGLTVWALWMLVMEKQKKHEWNELELTVRFLTKLQPHFTTPWLYQSWNLAYNVSVESDRVNDKYFYITRGIELLAEGERQNANNPDLRWNLGYYYQDKLGMADEHNTLRSLFQLGSIDPEERKPGNFRRPNSDRVDFMDKFEEFCKKHPMLIRRLRETPGKKPDEVICKTPEDVVDFLAANRKVPSRFEDVSSTSGQESTPLKPPNEQFPVMPPPSRFGGSQEISYDSPSTEFGDRFDNFAAARAWFSYAQDPLDVGRAPKYPMTVIFQGFPSRAQYYLAEFCEKEGWYDEDGWEIKDWFPADQNQPDGPKHSVRVGTDHPWAIEAWERAYQMVKERGDRTRLNVDPGLAGQMDEGTMRNRAMALNITNYNHFLVTSRVERTLPAVTARKLFAYAEKFDALGDYDQALPFYEKPEAFGDPSTWNNAKATGWRRVLLDNPDYAQEDDVQEDSYVFQHQYKHSIQELKGIFFKQLVVLADYLGQAATRTPGVASWQPPPQLSRRLHAQLIGPLDDRDRQGKPLIGQDAVTSARQRLGLFSFTSPSPPSPERMQEYMEQKKQSSTRRAK